MTAQQSTVLVIGLPEAGKTTFLAALWHLAESEEVPASLVLEKLSDDAKHLNHIKSAWLQHSKVGRTNQNSEQTVSMLLRERNEAKTGMIVFPDLSGETFRQQWTHRFWTTEYAALAERAVGAILFIHPDQITTPFTFAQAHQLMAAAEPAASAEAEMEVQALFRKEEQDEIADHDPYVRALDDPGDDAGDAHAEPRNTAAVGATWNPDKATPQVQLVDLLQFLAGRPNGVRPIRLAVVVSAWDKIEDITAKEAAGNAEAWIRDRTPLLYQYLMCNQDEFQSSFYALSAEGGDTKDEGSRARWRGIHAQSDRIFVAGPDCSPHDITEPVRRVLGFRG